MSNARWRIGGTLAVLAMVTVSTGGCDDGLLPSGPSGLDDRPDTSAPASSSTSVGEILFTTNRDGNMEIYAMKSDGSEPVNLTNHPWEDWRPAWSPDGRRIAFERAEPGGDPNSDIYLMDADGANPVRLTHGAQPAWSPDGTRIAFWRLREDDSWWGLTTDIWVMDADGGNVSRLVTDGWYPAWSPDGTRIAFATSGLIKVMDADGSNPRLLATGSHPAWSPDGTRIAFTATFEGSQEAFVMDADGSNPVNVSRHPATDWMPAWSPDGTKLLFVSDRSGGRDVYVMNADGTDPVNLTNHPSCVAAQPSWISSH